ncbi:MAG: hypothetical protein QM666_10810 [Acinetobacter sp.]
MAKTQAEIQKESDERRGMKSKSFKLSTDTVDKIADFAAQHNIPQNQLITDAIDLYIKQHSPII